MRICIDISPAAHRKAGLGRHARELAERAHRLDILNDYTLFTYQPSRGQVPPSLAHLPTYSVPWPAKPWRMSVLLAHYARVPQDGLVPGVDVFHGTDHLLPYFRRIRTVFTLHDLIPLLFPEFHLPLNRWFLNLMFPRFLRRADAIVAVSECTKKDAIRIYGTPEEKITVIYNGVDARFHPVRDAETLRRVRAAYRLPEAYILYVGTIEPRKNLARLLDAYHALRQAGYPHKLAIVGAKGWLYQPVFDRIAALGLQDEVIFPGYIADEDLPAVYSGAALFAFPSLYEGFGIPPLEAMACGVPTLVSDTSSLPEVVGDAALQVSPTDTGAIKAGMERILSDAALARELAGRGPERARMFTWDKAARQLVDLYHAVGAMRESPSDHERRAP
jgi:glycosyltransferase involved in cell wall biosynthesis